MLEFPHSAAEVDAADWRLLKVDYVVVGRLVPLPDVCPLAVHGGALWAGGLGASLQNAQAAAPVSHAHGRSLRGVRLDNHWAVAS